MLRTRLVAAATSARSDRSNGSGTELSTKEGSASPAAPGYLLECMTYNVPPSEFVPNDSARLNKVVRHLKFAEKARFMSCDGIHTLFGTDPGDFSVSTAQHVIDALWETY